MKGCFLSIRKTRTRRGRFSKLLRNPASAKKRCLCCTGKTLPNTSPLHPVKYVLVCLKLKGFQNLQKLTLKIKNKLKNIDTCSLQNVLKKVPVNFRKADEKFLIKAKCLLIIATSGIRKTTFVHSEYVTFMQGASKLQQIY